MKILFIEARKKTGEIKKENIEKIKKKFSDVHILYSIQYKDLAEKIRKEIKDKVKIKGFNQVLGCSKVNPKAPFLLIGSGKFHGINLALNSGKEVYIYDYGKISKISKKEIEKQEKKNKGKLSKFYNSDKIGILVSEKPGQKNLKQAEKINKILEKKFPEKKICLFIGNNIDINELENYDIDFWINTACPGLEYDHRNTINFSNLSEII